jgi:alkaline phosphatase D
LDGRVPLTRRDLVLRGSALAGAAFVAPPAAFARTGARPLAKAAVTDAAFSCGVAAGIPGQRSALLWTRLDGLTRSGTIGYEVATDPGFARIVDRGTATVDAARDFTVHLPVSRGLQPGTQYHYRFSTRAGSSPVGRFRTLRPADSREPVRIALWSCQSYEAGYYTAHAALAQEDVDLVVFLGDYVYERHYYDGPRTDATGVNRDGDVQTLPEYRQKYRLYKSDANLRAMHASVAFAPMWDDHEVEDNYAGSQPDSASKDPQHFENDDTTPRRVSFAERRAAGYRAYLEYQPRRLGSASAPTIYGAIPLGANATVFLTDERQYRSPQPCKDGVSTPCVEALSPSQTMLGATQKAWLERALAAERATWKLWANEVMVMALDGAPGVPLNLDQWDGYAAERAEILTSAVRQGVQNLAVLTGDIHTFFAGDVTTTGRTGGLPAGVEFVGGSITSRGLDSLAPAGTLPAVEAALLATNPHLRYVNGSRRGYMVVEATQQSLDVRFRAPASTLTPTSPTSDLAHFTVAAGVPHVVRA